MTKLYQVHPPYYISPLQIQIPINNLNLSVDLFLLILFQNLQNSNFGGVGNFLERILRVDFLVAKDFLKASLAKWLSVRLRIKWLWVRISLLSLKHISEINGKCFERFIFFFGFHREFDIVTDFLFGIVVAKSISFNLFLVFNFR